MQNPNSGALLAALSLYFCVAFILPTVRVWRQSGLVAYVLPSSDDAYGFVSRCMKFVMVGLFLYLSARLLWPEIDLAWGPIRQCESAVMRLVGWLALGAATLWTVVAQLQMGLSWRIGIDTAQPTELVKSGLFRCSRNPIFLAMRVSLLACFMIEPNAITLGLFLVGDLVMQFQVRLEEAWLQQRHGQAYADYCAQVRRWL